MIDSEKSIALCALDNMYTAVIMLDHNFIVKYANNATEQIFRMSHKKFLGKNSIKSLTTQILISIDYILVIQKI